MFKLNLGDWMGFACAIDNCDNLRTPGSETENHGRNGLLSALSVVGHIQRNPFFYTLVTNRSDGAKLI